MYLLAALLLRVEEPWRRKSMRMFLKTTVPHLALEAKGLPTLNLQIRGTGLPMGEGTWIVVPMVPRAREDLQRGVRYTLRFADEAAWAVRDGVSILRP